MENQPERSPDGGKHSSGVARDLNRLKVHGTASAAELREFFARMRGRSPQEVLGLVAASQLVRSLTLATLAAVVLLGALSVGPYLIYGPPGAAPAKKRVAAEPATNAQTPVAPTPPASPATSPTHPTASPKTAETQVQPADAEKAVKIMGIGETKVADPKKNPLEDKLDRLLDKAE